jgi:ubiquinone/menaquinone biosynthesis C-methylase UbiE
MPHPPRQRDGSAGDVDYASIGPVYRDDRAADPRIASMIHAALGDARTVLNVGAATRSYEPTDPEITAVEPSATMRERRPAHLPPAIDAYAESLPFPDRSFDAAMASFTAHESRALAAGLA